MGIIDQKLNDYVWEHIRLLEAIFSEKIYRILLRFKDKEDRESFSDTLEAVVEVDSELLENLNFINKTYKNKIKSNLDLNKIYFKKAFDYANLKEYDNAIKFYQKVIYKDSKYTNAYYNLGIIYKELKEYTKAIECYQEAILIDSKHTKAYNNLGIVYKELREYTNAIEYYQKAIKINIQDNSAFNNLNILMNQLNKAFFLNKKISNLNFFINRITIQNFKQYKNFSIDFSKQINIIIGQNATGKTTLLQAITLGLLKDKFFDARKLDYDKYITKDENEAKIIIGHNGVQEKLVILKKDGREIEKKDNYFIPFVLAYGSNFFTKYNLSADKIVDDILDETIHKKIANSIFEDFVDEFWNPLTILNELDRSDHKKAKRKKCIIFLIINKFLEEYKIIEEKQRYFFQKGDDKTKLYLEDLSEGYRGNVLLLTDMLIKILGMGWTPKTIEGIILIDEFDKHLHPRWQSKLVHQLTKTFPKIQFIMTTHNPMSILDRESDEITMLREIDGEIKAIRGRGTKNMGVSIVLLEYFNVDSTVGNTMNENINNFNRLKLKKELTSTDKEELQKLEKILGATVASNVIFDRKYLKFLEFIRDHKDIDFDKYEKINEDEMSEFLKDFGDFFDD